MAEERNLLTTVDGPNGSAEVYEVYDDGSTMPHYEVRFKDVVRSFQAEGAASIEATELVGISL